MGKEGVIKSDLGHKNVVAPLPLKKRCICSRKKTHHVTPPHVGVTKSKKKVFLWTIGGNIKKYRVKVLMQRIWTYSDETQLVTFCRLSPPLSSSSLKSCCPFKKDNFSFGMDGNNFALKKKALTCDFWQSKLCVVHRFIHFF